jgi:hypothetical protein
VPVVVYAGVYLKPVPNKLVPEDAPPNREVVPPAVALVDKLFPNKPPADLTLAAADSYLFSLLTS